MKKKLQKYLSGSNEGFSLVELIIVIAIMAILIGVVALAVIPYLEKSRESKDLQALSSLSSALSSAVADTKVTAAKSFTITDGSAISTTDSDADIQKVKKAMADSLGGAAVDLSSSGANGYDITCYFDPPNNVVAVYVGSGQTGQPTGTGLSQSITLGSGDGATSKNIQCCKYNDNAPLLVSNGATGMTTPTT